MHLFFWLISFLWYSGKGSGGKERNRNWGSRRARRRFWGHRWVRGWDGGVGFQMFWTGRRRCFDSPGCFMLKPTGPVPNNVVHSCQFCHWRCIAFIVTKCNIVLRMVTSFVLWQVWRIVFGSQSKISHSCRGFRRMDMMPYTTTKALFGYAGTDSGLAWWSSCFEGLFMGAICNFFLVDPVFCVL